MTARRMLFGNAGGPYHGPVSLPTDWALARASGNPLLTNTAGEPTEMYVPAAVELPSGLVYAYCKGSARIYAWAAADAGGPFVLANGGGQVIGPVAATWESNFTLEPTVLYDADNDLIHMWYKGRAAASDSWAWGHATAPGSDPTNFTKDAANPILTSDDVETDLGSGNITDLGTGCVVVGPDGTFHFYGYALYGGIYHLFQATGTTFNDPGSCEEILDAPGGAVNTVETPDVVRIPGLGAPRYAMFYAIGQDAPGSRTIRVGTSTDLETWDFSDTTDLISPTGSGWEEDEAFSGHFLKENASPWLAPKIDSTGRWRYYYSGLKDTHAQSGLAYFSPTRT